MSDARVMRGRQEDAASAVRRQTSAGLHGSEAVLVQTMARGNYPTIASAFYACTPLRIDGPETEGASATFSVDSSRTIMALNLGSKSPPVGTKLIIHSSGGRWAFRYDG
ncbi:MAG: hypothetical protein BGO49_17410 [Planctomycetales bacterium 71-10]|nr:MAG: hypothetical protein BGO49_17410 [Planctomycetales bacterium 71-10]